MSDSEDEESVWRLIAADEELRLSWIAAAPAAPAAAQLVFRAAAPAAPAAAQGDHWGGEGGKERSFQGVSRKT